jgi:hypothetical protein
MTMRWDRPRSVLSAELRDAARSVFEAEGGGDAHTFAAISGSLVAGFGHGLSDVDIYVVPRPGVRRSGRRYTELGRRIQLNRVTPERFARLCGIGTRFTATIRDRAHLDLPELDLKYLVNLAIADVIHAETEPAAVHGAIDRAAVRQLLLVTRALDMSRYAEDCHGALESGDALVAVRAARLALHFGVELGATASDELYQGKHFLYDRVQRAGLLDEPTWDLLSRGVAWRASTEEVANYVDRCLTLASHLSAHAMYGGWAEPLRGVPALPARPVGPRRDPYHALVRYADGPTLSGPLQGLRISDDVALLWSLLDGSPLQDVIARIGRITDGRISASDVAVAVDRLRALGAVQEPDDRSGSRRADQLADTPA